jgi:hypothetical protein
MSALGVKLICTTFNRNLTNDLKTPNIMNMKTLDVSHNCIFKPLKHVLRKSGREMHRKATGLYQTVG